ncbi:hypothetical protein BX616_001165 [Lobosporangium transversale]|nr:hypothetical protein BX616_001165 [Lobosporangium transversale]
MSSYNPTSYINNTPADSTEHWHQKLSPSHSHYSYPHPTQQQPQQHLHHHPNSQRSMLEISHSKKLVARIEGEEEDLEVIGSGIAGSYEPLPSKARLPTKLPKLRYDYPQASVQNFSPGTSLIFNAYRGHSALLTHPNMSSPEDIDNYAHGRMIQHGARNYLSQGAHLEHPRQRVTYPSHESDSHPSYPHSGPDEQSSPYRPPHESQPHSYAVNGVSRASRDYRDYRASRDPRENCDPRDYERSPGMSSAVSMPTMDQSRDDRGRPSDYHDHPHPPRDHYPPQAPQQVPPPPPPPPPPPTQHFPPDEAHTIPPTHRSMSGPSHWKRPDSDHHGPRQPYENNSPHPPPGPSIPQSSSAREPWDPSTESRLPRSTAAIDIPQPRNRSSTNYPNTFDSHDSMDSNMRDHSRQHRMPAGHQGGPDIPAEGPGFRGPYSQRSTGPRYALSRINYRMGCRVDIDPNAPTEDEATVSPHQLRCTSCNSVKTPEWRKGPLGPRTLCNACGLIWGKMSRSKAALAKNKLEAASKADSSITDAAIGDTQMTDATAGSDIGSLGSSTIVESSAPNEGTRKRGRDLASSQDEDEEESLARDEDRKVIEESTQEVQQMHQKLSAQEPLHDPPPTNHNVDTASYGPCEQEMRSAAEKENQEKDIPAGGRKLALSYLLA